jgi:hypothetical protein
MRTTFARRQPPLAAVLPGALILFACFAPPSLTAPAMTSSEDEWTSMEQALGILWTGDPAVKREVADDAYFRFGPLFGPHPGDDEDVARILATLTSLIRSEKDDFISYRLLSELSDRDGEILTPLFLEALKSRSANHRGRAIHWFAGHTDPGAPPELEFDWRHEERPWVREDLMIALVRHGFRDDFGGFLDLARGEDAALATAAIRALTLIGEPRVVPFLVRIARATSSSSGLLAVDALARWPDSREALEAVLEASRSPRADFQRHAAAALGRFDGPAAETRPRFRRAETTSPWKWMSL